MALIDTFRRVGVSPADSRVSYDWTLHTPDARHPFHKRRLFNPKESDFEDGAPSEVGEPLVSCLMVTTGERFSIGCALECYRRQLYENRELVIVTYGDRLDAVQRLVEASGVANASVHAAGRDLALGEMRNMALGRARGEILVQWDDDDLYDPLRISAAATLLSRSSASAALLRRMLIWWPDRELAAISASRSWEGSIAVWRAFAPVYPALDREEDIHAVGFLARTSPLLGFDASLLYVHVAHGGNTREASHFERHLRDATCVLRGSDYAELIALLATRMPILDYRAGGLSS
ncbi:MAG TPA: hypothetical protein VHZ26_10325 [Caulobacteraceae bacterium]|jgi:hypothetical protein|nr:hypothetical protein [Caulobacteraceae bacterium]